MDTETGSHKKTNTCDATYARYQKSHDHGHRRRTGLVVPGAAGRGKEDFAVEWKEFRFCHTRKEFWTCFTPMSIH